MSRVLRVLLLVTVPLYAQSFRQPGLPVKSFSFLLGNWVSVQQPGEGSGTSVFSLEAQGSVVLRKNHAEYPASARGPAGVHDDIMMIFRGDSPDTLRATYADNEGHLIEYVVGSPGEGEVLFTSEPSSGSPRYRLWYGRVAADTVAGRFEIAPPGRPNAFTRYLEWRMVRSQAAQPVH